LLFPEHVVQETTWFHFDSQFERICSTEWRTQRETARAAGCCG